MNIDMTGLRPLPQVLACCTPLDTPRLSPEDAEATALLFKALAEPARVIILNRLLTAGSAVCACDLQGPLGLAQPTVSHHLKKLTRAGLLQREQRGVWAYYVVDRAAVARLASLLDLTGGTS